MKKGKKAIQIALALISAGILFVILFLLGMNVAEWWKAAHRELEGQTRAKARAEVHAECLEQSRK